MMQLLEALKLEAPARVALVGAGGKTTALFQLARQLPGPVIVTTTTHLAVKEAELADRHFVVQSPEQVERIASEWMDVGQALHPNRVFSLSGQTKSLPYISNKLLLLSGGEVANERLAGLDEPTLERVKALAETMGASLLIEADGSRRLPVKAPAAHEPVIPAWVDLVMVVVGLSGLGQPLDDNRVHRPERVSAITGLMIGDSLTPQALVSLLLSPQGGLKGIPPQARRIALLNQADSARQQAQAKSMAEALLPGYERVIIASLGLSPEESRLDVIAPYTGPVYAVYACVAGIILAAGGSTRLGQPKQLLDWFGRPFVRQAAETALKAGLSPVVVVTGAVQAEIEQTLEGLPVKFVHNLQWASGMSSSLKAGLGAVPVGSGGAIFMLADQPQVPVSLLMKLVETQQGSPVKIVAPQVDGSRANPVLFDCSTFVDLMALQGDVGGRALVSKYPVAWVEWADARLLMDVDTAEDYANLIAAMEES
jgi:molybdenum cofactor cytidylyltransferase